jgi:hypothetical protein
MMNELRRLLEMAWARIAALLQTAPPGSLQLTGVLGLATLVAGYYHLRGRGGGGDGASSSSGAGGGASSSSGGSRAPPSSRASGPSPSSTAAAAAAAALPHHLPQQQQYSGYQQQQQPPKRGGPSAGGAAPAPSGRGGAAASDTPLAAAVRARLAGARRVTVSVPGVLLEQREASDLSDAASARPDALRALRELARAAEVFLLAHVPDDVGAALVAGALEAAGALGGAAGQVAPQRLLLCGTADGKISIVRQLEPDLHIDASARTIGDLSRFVPQLLLIAEPGPDGPPGIAAAANVEAAPSLAAFVLGGGGSGGAGAAGARS